MKAWIRTVVFSVFTLAFLALAVATLVLSGPWYVTLAYVVCGSVTALTAARLRPTAAAPRPSDPGGVPDPRRSRRSGNPAVRAQSDQHRDDGR